MNNLEIYEKVRVVPQNATKTINGGRLKGMTDINPMWRIKTLTEQFGVCGIGWKTEVIRTWLESGANGEISANVEIKLHIKLDGNWSEGIPGIGGSKFVSKESSGTYTDDECYKKAYTDALSVACKALGIGADVYWDKDSTKYDQPSSNGNTTQGTNGGNNGVPKDLPTVQQLAELKQHKRTLAHVAKANNIEEKAVTSAHVADYLDKVKKFKAEQAAKKKAQEEAAKAAAEQAEKEAEEKFGGAE